MLWSKFKMFCELTGLRNSLSAKCELVLICVYVFNLQCCRSTTSFCRGGKEMGKKMKNGQGSAESELCIGEVKIQNVFEF